MQQTEHCHCTTCRLGTTSRGHCSSVLCGLLCQGCSSSHQSVRTTRRSGWAMLQSQARSRRRRVTPQHLAILRMTTGFRGRGFSRRRQSTSRWSRAIRQHLVVTLRREAMPRSTKRLKRRVFLYGWHPVSHCGSQVPWQTSASKCHREPRYKRWRW